MTTPDQVVVIRDAENDSPSTIDLASQNPDALALAGEAKLRVKNGVLEVSISGQDYVALASSQASSDITFAVGDVSGYDLDGNLPGQTTRIVGATSLATLTTGLNAGTAGTGTTTTSLVKQNGSANLTAHDAIGKWVKRIGGGGYVADGDNLALIIENTTSAFTLDAPLAGLDDTSLYQIVDLASVPQAISGSDLVAIRIQNCLGPVELVGLQLTQSGLDSLVEIIGSTKVILTACNIAVSTNNPSVIVPLGTKFEMNHCRIAAGADIEASEAFSFVANGVTNSAGGVIDVSDSVYVDIRKLRATSSVDRVLSIKRCFSSKVEAACSGGGATPIYLEDTTTFTAVGGGLTGSGNTGYGLEVGRSGGLITLTGSSITGGTGDVLFEGNAITWSNELGSTYGAVRSASGGIVAQVAVTKTIVYGNQLFYGSGDHSSRELFYGIINPAQNTGLTATGSSVSDALALPAGQFYRIDSAPVGTGVKIHNAAALAGPQVTIFNNGANNLKVYPPTTGTIQGGASDTLTPGSIQTYYAISDDGLSWRHI